MNPRNSFRALPAALIFALAVGVGGCGSGSSSTGTNRATTALPTRSATTPAAPASRGPAESSPGSSIKEYGTAAAGAGKAAVTAAAHSFFTAMATHDYAALCAGLAASNREQLAAVAKGEGGPGGCAAALKKLIGSAAAATEAREAAAAPITSVRIKGATAFVLFTPKGGSASYFVMEEEEGRWKAISLEPGAPLNPGAAP